MLPRDTVGIVLHEKDYRESDRIVTFYSPDSGKTAGVAFVARRSRKRFANCLDLFCKSRFSYVARRDSELVRLERCDLIDSYPAIRDQEKTLAYAAYLVDVVFRLTAAGDPNPALFHLLDTALQWLNSRKPENQVARIFEVRASSLLGYQLELEKCTGCGKALSGAQSAGFSAANGGIVCDRCSPTEKRRLSPGTIRALRYIQSRPLETLPRLNLTSLNVREAGKVLRDFLIGLLHKQLRTMNYIDRLEEKENR